MHLFNKKTNLTRVIRSGTAQSCPELLLASKGMQQIRMAPYAQKYGKHDMKRLGLFVDIPYMNGEGYAPASKKRPATAGNMHCEGNKIRDATGAGYFDKEFKRLFEGDCVTDKSGKKNAYIPFVVGGATKPFLCPGHPHGSFEGNIEHFSAELVKPKGDLLGKKKQILSHFNTSPGKKGGPGYPNICLSKYPEHDDDPYQPKLKPKMYGKILNGPLLTAIYPQAYFDNNPYLEKDLGQVCTPLKQKVWSPTGPSKQQGGCHAGAFGPRLQYMTERDQEME